MQRKGSSDSGSNVPDSTATFSSSSSSRETSTGNGSGVSVKLESVDGDDSKPDRHNNFQSGGSNRQTEGQSRKELAISALKSSCSVTLDKAKVDGHDPKVIKLTTKPFGGSNGDSAAAVENQPMDFSKSKDDSSSSSSVGQEKSLRVESTTADSSTMSSSSSSAAAVAIVGAPSATGVTITAEKKKRSGFLANDESPQNSKSLSSGVTIEQISAPKQEPGVR